MTTPTLSEVLTDYVAQGLGDLLIALPGTVVIYDPATRQATVKVSVQLKSQDPNAETEDAFRDLPQIGGVPVVFPGGGGYSVLFPITPGDNVLLIVCSSAIEEWLSLGTTLQSSNRRHSLSDCVAIPGLLNGPSAAQKTPIAPGSASFGNNATGIWIDDSIGEVKVGSVFATAKAARDDLVDANFTAIATWSALIHTFLVSLGYAGPALGSMSPTGATKTKVA
jgi:hypothetical protein